MAELRIGFIGLGNMGSPMALNIARGGYPLVVYDVNSAAFAKLEGHNALLADSPKQVAAQAQVIFSSLPSVRVSEEIWLGPEGVLAGAAPGSIFVELSTVTPELVREIGAQSNRKNIKTLDAGVSGGVAKAADGSLTIMVGGAKEAFDMVLPLFKLIGSKIYHVGELGSGMVVKLINNAIAHINVVAFLECISVGLKAGVNIRTMYEVISQGTGNSRQFETRFKDRVMEINFKPGMKLDLVYKDSSLMLEMASQTGVPVFLTSVAHQVFETGLAKGLGQMDYASLIKLWDELR
jgi:2-hydroxymethylglutarate dehydrogenase